MTSSPLKFEHYYINIYNIYIHHVAFDIVINLNIVKNIKKIRCIKQSLIIAPYFYLFAYKISFVKLNQSIQRRNLTHLQLYLLKYDLTIMIA